MSSTLLRVHHWLPKVQDVLGPGNRAVVWVQGCSLACKGCMVPETWGVQTATLFDPQVLAEQIALVPEVTGVTVSGGEPTEQAHSVARLLFHLKARGLNTWLYSGYRLEELVARDDADTDYLLSLVDVLVDGRYDIQQAGTFRWRGSANQRIIHLTDAISPSLTAGEESGGVQVTVDKDGQLMVVGVPPPDFLPHFRSLLLKRGLTLHSDAPWK